MSEVLENIVNKKKGDTVTGSILVRTTEIRKTKTGGDFLTGVYEANGSHGFKIWGGVLLDSLRETELAGKVAVVTGIVDDYGGVKSLVVTNLSLVEGANILEFIETPYSEEYVESFYNSIRGKLSEDGVTILDAIMDKYGDRFQEEFAAISHHDAVPRGLIAHSMKVARIALLLTNMYPGITARGTDRDFYILASLLHDIGKIREYNEGVFNEEDGWKTHRYFGLEILGEFKELIKEKKGKRWYDRMQCVVMQHHGEWGERPQVVEAMIVHLADYLESQMTDINTAMTSEGLKDVRVSGFRLRL